MPRKAALKRRRKSKESVGKSLRRSRRKATSHWGRVFLLSSTFFFAVVFLSIVFLYRIVTTNIASALSPSSYDILNQDLYTVAYLSVEDSLDVEPAVLSYVSLLVVDGANDKAFIFEVPPDLIVDVPGRFGNEELSKVLSLGMLSDNNDATNTNGINLVTATLGKIFGVHVDRYLLTDSAHRSDLDALLLSGEFSALLHLRLTRDLHTVFQSDMSLNELYALHRYMGNLSSENTIIHTVPHSLGDNVSKLDALIRDITYASLVANEKKNIAVLNGTLLPGVAGFGSRAVENIGGRVIAVENAQNLYEESILVVDDVSSATTAYIARFFNLDNITSLSEASHIDENVIDRADVTLILGLDIAENL